MQKVEAFPVGTVARHLFLQIPRRLTTSSNTVFRQSSSEDIGSITPRNNSMLFDPNQLTSLFARRPEMASPPPPLRQKSAPVKEEWDTQMPSAITTTTEAADFLNKQSKNSERVAQIFGRFLRHHRLQGMQNSVACQFQCKTTLGPPPLLPVSKSLTIGMGKILAC